MRFNYIIYPEAQKRLDDAGLTARIVKAHKEYKINLAGHMLESEIVDCIKEMKDKKVFDTIYDEEREKSREVVNLAWKNRDKSVFWTVERKEGTYKEKVEPEDFLLFTGWKAFQLLKKDELFNYKKFGFSSAFEFAGTIGAAIEGELHRDIFREGYHWQTTHQNGMIFDNRITGDTNSDLRVFQNEITPYPTIDPIGNKVLYRPETDPDRKGIFAYHTNEGAMLIAVLKWIEQTRLTPKSVGKNTHETINWVRSLGQRGGTCAEHFGGFDQDVRLFFMGWDMPLLKLGEKESKGRRTTDYLQTQSDGAYRAYVGANNELVFRYEKIENGKVDRTGVDATFIPSDADHLIKGLLYQCAEGLGRTSAKQLIDILSFRYSPSFESNLRSFGITDPSTLSRLK